jgi:hypothetical protein
MGARLACLPWTIGRHHGGMGRASFAFARGVRFGCFSHFRGTNLRRALRIAPELLDLLLCPQKSLDHARERCPLLGRELAPADRRKDRGNGNRGVRSFRERRQIDLDGRAFAFRKNRPHKAAEHPGIPHFRLLDELVSEGLAVALDELLQEDGCLVACTARAAGRIAALTWLEGHRLSPWVAGTKEPAMRGHHGQKNPARLPARAHVRKVAVSTTVAVRLASVLLMQ